DLSPRGAQRRRAATRVADHRPRVRRGDGIAGCRRIGARGAISASAELYCRGRPMIESRTGKWETVIGLEVHAQVASKAKLFSGAATAFGAEPNTQVSPVDAAFPGMLPVINRHCVEQAVKTGLGLAAEINLASVFG